MAISDVVTPDLIILGAQKSASTFITDALQEHPKICIESDECAIFEDPDFELFDKNFFKNMHCVTSRPQKSGLFGIKRPSYIGRPEVPSRIKKYCPNAKLIAILRNPVDRAISAYFHYVNYGFLPLQNPNEGLRKILYDNNFRNKYKRSYEVLEYGLYGKYLSLYKSDELLHKMLVLFHDDITNNSRLELSKIFKYLEVDDISDKVDIENRPQQVVYNIYRLFFLRLRNPFMFEYNRDKTRIYVKKNKIGRVFSSVIFHLDKMLISKIFVKKFKVSNEIRNEIYKFYKEDIERLEELVKVELPRKWKSYIT